MLVVAINALAMAPKSVAIDQISSSVLIRIANFIKKSSSIDH